MSSSPEQAQVTGALQQAPAEPPLQPYLEADDLATRYFETPRPPPTWLVQLSLFERPLMTKDQLLDELQNGLVRASTLVWRAGMRDWCPVAQVEELRRALPLHLVPGASSELPQRHRAGSAWLYGVAALLMLSVALYALSAAGVFDTGVFDTGARAGRAGPSSVSASIAEPER